MHHLENYNRGICSGILVPLSTEIEIRKLCLCTWKEKHYAHKVFFSFFIFFCSFPLNCLLFVLEVFFFHLFCFNLSIMNFHLITSLLLLLLPSPFSHVRLCTTPCTAAYQAPLSMGFSRQEYWSGSPLPSLHSIFTRSKLKTTQHWTINL